MERPSHPQYRTTMPRKCPGEDGLAAGPAGPARPGLQMPRFSVQTHSCPPPSHPPQTHFLVRHKDHKRCATPPRRKLWDRHTHTDGGLGVPGARGRLLTGAGSPSGELEIFRK